MAVALEFDVQDSNILPYTMPLARIPRRAPLPSLPIAVIAGPLSPENRAGVFETESGGESGPEGEA